MTTTTSPERKYVEVEYVMDQEVAAITRGLAQQGKDTDHPVHLFLTDSGLLAAVTLEEVSLDYMDALEMALDLAEDEIDQYIPGSYDDENDWAEPWRVLMVDHDRMAESLRQPALQSGPEAPDAPVPA